MVESAATDDDVVMDATRPGPAPPDLVARIARRIARCTPGAFATAEERCDAPGPSLQRAIVQAPRTQRQVDGDEGEAIARDFLERYGLACLATNVRFVDGEIDLVMHEPARDADRTATIVFVEVRRRRSGSHGGPVASVTSAKRRRLVAAAARYLASTRSRASPPCRFDLVTLEGSRRDGLRIAWHRDAFRADASSR